MFNKIKNKVTKGLTNGFISIKNKAKSINKNVINEVILLSGIGFIITSFYMLNIILGLFMTGVVLIAYSLLNN